MANFLQRMVRKGDENDARNIAMTDFSEKDDVTTKGSFSKTLRLKKQTDPLATSDSTRTPSRPTTLKLFTNSRPLPLNRRQGSDPKSAKSPTSSMIEDAIRDFEENYKSPSKTQPTPKSRNFVKRIVAALERKSANSGNDDEYRRNYDSGPILAYSEVNVRQSKAEAFEICYKYSSIDEKLFREDEARLTTTDKVEVEGSSDEKPRIVGAFLKKPIEIDDTAVDWIPITGKKLPRKRSFKKLLSMLTGKKKPETKAQPSLYASQRNLVDDIHDSGYDEKSFSSRSSSLVSINDTLITQGSSCIEPIHGGNTFSSFLTSSPLRKPEDEPTADIGNRNRTGKNLFPNDPEVVRTRRTDDSGYTSNYSNLEESLEQISNDQIKVKRLPQYLPQLPKDLWLGSEATSFPKHPWIEKESLSLPHHPLSYSEASLLDQHLWSRTGSSTLHCKPLANSESSIYHVPRQYSLARSKQTWTTLQSSMIQNGSSSTWEHLEIPKHLGSNSEYSELPGHLQSKSELPALQRKCWSNSESSKESQQLTFGGNLFMHHQQPQITSGLLTFPKRYSSSCDHFEIRRHPWSKSEPGLCSLKTKAPSHLGEIVELRRNQNEPIYDVPRPRPKSNAFEETVALRRKDAMLPSASKTGFTVFGNDEEPHYATVRPRISRTHHSCENIRSDYAEPRKLRPDGAFMNLGRGQFKAEEKVKESTSNSLYQRAASPFVLTMYV